MEFKNIAQCIINTGNILSVNDITRKSGQNPREELNEAISITVNEFKASNPIPGPNLRITRPSDDLKVKLQEQSLSDLKIGLKIFLSNDGTSLLQEAIDESFAALEVSSVHSIIIQYKHKEHAESDDGTIISLNKIWTVLEEYVHAGKIIQIGLADVEEAIFRNIYASSSIKPAIIQINLATCCVVPPTLQAFCKDNEVQLLTHSDPSEILTTKTVEDALGVALPTKWISRFLVHIKCRGVLCTKGYLIGLGDY